MNDTGVSQNVAERAQRVVFTIRRQPSWVAKTALIAGSLVALAIMLIVVVPVLIVMLLVFVVAMIIARIRAWFARLSAPNGPRDGRDNVRVIIKR